MQYLDFQVCVGGGVLVCHESEERGRKHCLNLGVLSFWREVERDGGVLSVLTGCRFVSVRDVKKMSK